MVRLHSAGPLSKDGVRARPRLDLQERISVLCVPRPVSAVAAKASGWNAWKISETPSRHEEPGGTKLYFGKWHVSPWPRRMSQARALMASPFLDMNPIAEPRFPDLAEDSTSS